MKGRPDDYARVVRDNWRSVKAYIVTGAHPSCVKMAKDEVRHIERNMERVLLADINRLRPSAKWFMAVIVCPGDDLGALAKWATRHEAGRIYFYLHKDADPQAFAAWRDAGLPLNHIDIEQRFTTYGRMHKTLGLDLSDQVYTDFA